MYNYTKFDLFCIYVFVHLTSEMVLRRNLYLPVSSRSSLGGTPTCLPPELSLFWLCHVGEVGCLLITQDLIYYYIYARVYLYIIHVYFCSPDIGNGP